MRLHFKLYSRSEQSADLLTCIKFEMTYYKNQPIQSNISNGATKHRLIYSTQLEPSNSYPNQAQRTHTETSQANKTRTRNETCLAVLQSNEEKFIAKPVETNPSNIMMGGGGEKVLGKIKIKVRNMFDAHHTKGA